jgi:small subunit ribosomal protein S21
MRVEVRNNDVEAAIRKLRRKVERGGVLKESKRRESYERPGERRRRKHGRAVGRLRKRAREMN